MLKLILWTLFVPGASFAQDLDAFQVATLLSQDKVAPCLKQLQGLPYRPSAVGVNHESENRRGRTTRIDYMLLIDDSILGTATIRVHEDMRIGKDGEKIFRVDGCEFTYAMD